MKRAVLDEAQPYAGAGCWTPASGQFRSNRAQVSKVSFVGGGVVGVVVGGVVVVGGGVVVVGGGGVVVVVQQEQQQQQQQGASEDTVRFFGFLLLESVSFSKSVFWESFLS